jgi:hypothetical protein
LSIVADCDDPESSSEEEPVHMVRPPALMKNIKSTGTQGKLVPEMARQLIRLLDQRERLLHWLRV